MPRVAYTESQKREAVALARVMGSELAGKETGIPWRTVRNWVTLAGDAPEVGAPPEFWKRIFEKTGAMLEGLIDSGAMKPSQVATIVGIADRNLREEKPEPPLEPLTPEQEWIDAAEKALHERYGRDAMLALIVALPWFETLPEDSVVTVPMMLDHIASLGDDLRAVREAQVAASHDAMVAQLARNRAIAVEWSRKSLDEETRALIARAEAYLEETKDAA